jgi:hypothetical protein
MTTLPGILNCRRTDREREREEETLSLSLFATVGALPRQLSSEGTVPASLKSEGTVSLSSTRNRALAFEMEYTYSEP